MKRFVLAVLTALLLGGAGWATEPAPPRESVRLIFDTDMGNDIDDALALAMIHALQSRGHCQLLAVTLSKDNPYAAALVDLLNTFYKRDTVPVGRVRNGAAPEDGKYLKPISEARDATGQLRYPRQIQPGSVVPEAVALLRKTLAAQPDGSVVVVVVGFSTNLARLLDSPPDATSPLTGRELVAQKVKLLSMMAGHFTYDAPLGAGEHNIVKDLPAAQKVLQSWPTPLYVSPYELGVKIKYPARSIEKDYAYVPHHPIAEAYRLYIKFPYDRPTWDLTSVLYAVLPDRGYFTFSSAGKVTVNETGRTSFEATAKGQHYLLSCNPAQAQRVLEAMIQLCSQPPHAH